MQDNNRHHRSPSGKHPRSRQALTVSSLVSDDTPKAIEKLLTEMRANPRSVSFSDAMRVAEHYFGKPRRKKRGSSHNIFKMPWGGDPRINLQAEGGNKAKAYQVQQLLEAIDKLKLLRASR